jgi:hypothetical protein
MTWAIPNFHFQSNIQGVLCLVASLAEHLLVRVRMAIFRESANEGKLNGRRHWEHERTSRLPSERRVGNRYGMAQQKVGKWPSAVRSMDEAHKCTILEGDGKIANGDISEDEGASVAKSFGKRRDLRSSTLDLHKSTERAKSRCGIQHRRARSY